MNRHKLDAGLARRNTAALHTCLLLAGLATLVYVLIYLSTI